MRFAAMGGMVAIVVMVSCVSAAGLPPNPERLTEAIDCEHALENLREAEMGSPLISAEENAVILEQVRELVRARCDRSQWPEGMSQSDE